MNNGITITEDDLTNTLFYGSALEVKGSFTKAEARQAARAMLAGPELLAAIDRLMLCPALNEDSAEPETVAAWQQALDAMRKAKGEPDPVAAAHRERRNAARLECHLTPVVGMAAFFRG